MPDHDLETLLTVKKKCSEGYRLEDLSKDDARKMKIDSPERLAVQCHLAWSQHFLLEASFPTGVRRAVRGQNWTKHEQDGKKCES